MENKIRLVVNNDINTISINTKKEEEQAETLCQAFLKQAMAINKLYDKE